MMKVVVSFLLVALLVAPTSAANLTGKILSCFGCSLERLPDLRSFLRDGEAEYVRRILASMERCCGMDPDPV